MIFPLEKFTIHELNTADRCLHFFLAFESIQVDHLNSHQIMPDEEEDEDFGAIKPVSIRNGWQDIC